MCLWAIYIFPRSICLFCCRKYVDWSWEYINRSHTYNNVESGTEAAQFPEKEHNIFVVVQLHSQQAKPNRWSLSGYPPAPQTALAAGQTKPRRPQWLSFPPLAALVAGPYQTRCVCSHSSKLSRSWILPIPLGWSGLRSSKSSRSTPKEYSSLLLQSSFSCKKLT